MKKLLLLLLLVSCKKEKQTDNIDKIGYEKMQQYYGNIDRGLNTTARRGNPNQFYFTCADSWETNIVAKGLAAEVDVKRLHVGSATMKSWWIAMTANYIDANGDNIRDWTQWGYAVDKGGIFPGFFRYRWNLTKHTGGGQAPPVIVYSGLNVPLEYNTKVRFEMKNIEGTTWWTFSRNGQEVFRADLEIIHSEGNLEACTESWGSPDFGPAIMTYYLDIFENGKWKHIPTGISNQYSWGIAGWVQDHNYKQSQFIMGGNTPLTVNTNPWLWFP